MITERELYQQVVRRAPGPRKKRLWPWIMVAIITGIAFGYWWAFNAYVAHGVM